MKNSCPPRSPESETPPFLGKSKHNQNTISKTMACVQFLEPWKHTRAHQECGLWLYQWLSSLSSSRLPHQRSPHPQYHLVPKWPAHCHCPRADPPHLGGWADPPGCKSQWRASRGVQLPGSERSRNTHAESIFGDPRWEISGLGTAARLFGNPSSGGTYWCHLWWVMSLYQENLTSGITSFSRAPGTDPSWAC